MNLSKTCLAAALSLSMAATAYAADTIKIGVSGPYTGGSSSMGVSMRAGVRLAAQDINANGGVLGRQLELIERDDEAKNERGVQISQELISRENVVATVGFINTGVTLAGTRFYQKAEIPVIVNVATGTVVSKQFEPPKYEHNYVFRTAAADNIQAPMIAAEAVTKRGLKKVAIMADSTNYGQLGREDMEKALDKLGVKPVVIEKFNIGDVDMTAQLLRAKEAGAEALLTYGIGPELAQLANGMAKLGWKVPMIGSWTLAMANFIDTARANGDGALMPQTFIQNPNTPKRKAFIDAYIKDNQPKNGVIESAVSAAQGYDSLLLLAAAIEQAGNTKGQDIRAALESLNKPIEGVIMTYEQPFSVSDHETIGSPDVVYMGEVSKGRVVFAHPEDEQRSVANSGQVAQK
ncbi:ABC transporter substrate-binding protein [Castellaniella sp.]|uniref:ABC transporter substrate-binding protein n=1 Tax=Castellaniella sp. TaxID=1955812 RepID=UPI002B0006B4|nr:ABC transporter substrate-binding protein [Castellaniella sp.]